MDVHGTRLARTLFTIAREWNAVPPNKGMELTVKSDTPFAKRRAKGAAFACSSSQTLGCFAYEANTYPIVLFIAD